jgi:mRNA interferase MazF
LYVPERGDVIWINLDPTLGHEQSGRRPALVLSPRRYNSLTGLLFMCPMTRSGKGYAFEVPIPPHLAFAGVILVDHARSVDWRHRETELFGKMPRAVVDSVVRTLFSLVGTPS